MPKALPSLLGAHEIGTRVAAVGFDWAQPSDVVTKIEEEVAELKRPSTAKGAARVEEEMGDLLFAIANLARKLGVEPESALRKANQKFSDALPGARTAPRSGRPLGPRCEAGGDGSGVGEREEAGMTDTRRSCHPRRSRALHATDSRVEHDGSADGRVEKRRLRPDVYERAAP